MRYRKDNSPARISGKDIVCTWIVAGTVLLLLAMTDIIWDRDIELRIHDQAPGVGAAVRTRADAFRP